MPALNTLLAGNLAEEEARRQGVDPKVARALLLSENSGFDRGGNVVTRASVDTGTTSPVGATGIMQVMPATAQGLIKTGFLSSSEKLDTPEGQIRAGVATIKEMQSRGITNPSEQAAYYNGGQRALDALRAGQPMNAETTGYLKKFGAHMGTEQGNPTINVTSTREGGSVSGRVLPPELSQKIANTSSAFTGLSEDLQRQLQAMGVQMMVDAKDQQGAVDQSARAGVAQETAKAATATTTNASRNDTLTAFGVNLNDPQNILANEVAKMRAASDEQSGVVDQIAALKTSDPLRDPVGWLINSFKQLPLIQKNNALEMVKGQAVDNIKTSQLLATQQANIQVPQLKDAISGEMLANQNRIIADAEGKKLELIGTARTKVAQILMETGHLAGTNLNQLMQQADIFGTRTSDNFSETSRDKEFNDELAGVNVTAKAMGLPLFDKLRWKALDADTKQRWVKMGYGSERTISPGDTIATLYDTYGANGLANVNKEAPMVGAFMKDIVDAGNAEFERIQAGAAQNPTNARIIAGAKTPMQQLTLGINKWMEKKDAEADPKKADFSTLPADNPYKFKPIQAAQALPDSPISKAIIGRPNGIPVNDQSILAIAGGDVLAGKKSAAQASQELYDFYRNGMMKQSQDQGMKALGITYKPSYPMVTKLYGGSMPVDMMNRDSIENFLVRQIAAGKINATVDTGVAQPMRLMR